MKNLYLFALLVSGFALAQSNQKVIEDIANAEMKGASKKMAVVINPDTYNYDVTYAKLEFGFNLDNIVYDGSNNGHLFLDGKVTTDFTILSNTNTITFDLTKDANEPNYFLTVDSVTSQGNALPFLQNNNDELIITYPTTLVSGSTQSVVIHYTGYPSGSGFGSFVADEHNGTPVMWTLSEPFGARDWWPCKQDLNDKIDNGIDVFITAPTAYTAISNGLQQGKINNGDGTSTTHWRHNHPIPAYLIAIACTNYQLYAQQGGLGTAGSPFFPIDNYMYPETAAANIASVAPTPAIINFYESKFGNYAFRDEKYGHVQFGWGGGMEHTTASYMTANSNGSYSRSLIAHEMGHQWFGDKVTCGSWRDIWLNEGFATYLASLVIENFDGDAAFTADKGNMINNITYYTNGAVYLTENEALDVNRIFSSRLTYNKGAMVLNMLRFRMGDTAFFQALQNYLNDPMHAYGYALTPDLQLKLEETSGLNLDEFFNDWIYKQGYPIYSIVATNTSAGHATILINQSQSNNSVDFFEGPVPIRLLGNSGQQMDVVLDDQTDAQVFNIDVAFPISSVIFNPKNDIISKNSSATLGTQNFDLTSGIALYPNPAANTITLSLPSDVTVEKTVFYNALGQKMKESTGEIKWDISDLSSGVYFVNVTSNAGTKQLKFLKK